MTGPLLETKGLTKNYGGPKPALENLNLSISRGEVFGLLGPNGSGKSTALRMILGFMKPTRGWARVAGLDSWADSVEIRKRVTYLPGELRLYETMTGRQLIRFLGGLRGGDYVADPDDLARKLDIDLDRPLVQMSSGMKRKVALITVLLPRVDLVILDEPTNTLDPTMRDELLGQLKAARDRGQTIVFSSHVLAEVEQICDRVGILHEGRLVHLQKMNEITAKRVRLKFSADATSWPENVAPERQPDGSIAFDYSGSVHDLTQWLARQQLADLRVDSVGLMPIYVKYHGTP